jgi:hypothetical protein
MRSTVFDSLPISTLQKMPAEEFPDDLTKVSVLEKSLRFFRTPSHNRLVFWEPPLGLSWKFYLKARFVVQYRESRFQRRGEMGKSKSV